MSVIDNVGQSIAAIFGRVGDHLRGKAEHFARLATGPGVEGWLLPEIRAALNWGDPPVLPAKQWAGIESRQRDLVIFADTDATVPERWSAAHVVQVKLLSSSDPPHNATPKVLKPLRDRMFARQRNETESTQRSALIFAVWDSWGSFYSGFGEYLETLGGELRAVFGANDFVIGGEHLPTILGPISLKIAGRPAEVRLAGTWIGARIPHRFKDFLPSEIEEALRRAVERGPTYTTPQVLGHLRSLDYR